VSLALSADGNTLFASGFGLQVLDISVKDRLKLLRSEFPSSVDEASFIPWSVALSPVDELFLTNQATFNIYDRADFHLIRSSLSLTGARAVVLSKDHNTASILRIQSEKQVIIERVDVRDTKNPFKVKSYTIDVPIDFKSLDNFMRSPDERYFFFTAAIKEGVKRFSRIFTFDVLNEGLVEQEEDSQSIISGAYSLLFTSDERGLIAGFNEYIATIELYRDYPNNRIFSINSNTLAQIPKTNTSRQYLSHLRLSPNGQFLYSLEDGRDNTELLIYDVSNPSLPIKINSFPGGSNPISIFPSKDSKRLNIAYTREIAVYDSVSMEKLGAFHSDQFQIKEAVFTSDAKIGFSILVLNANFFHLKSLDLSNPADSITEIAMKYYFENHPTMLLAISPDDKTLFLVHKNLLIYDVSDPKNLIQISSLPLLSDEYESYPASVSISHNGKLLFILTSDFINSYLKIVDVSNPRSPRFLSTFTSPQLVDSRTIPVGLSSDGTLLYTEGVHAGIPSLFVLNISDPTSPILQSVVHVNEAKGDPVNAFAISPDGQTTYLASDKDQRIYVNSLKVPNTLYIGSEIFRLGEKSSNNVMVLRQEKNKNYVPFGKNYRFMKASLFALKVITTEESAESRFIPFPYWMTFQKESNTFTLEPQKQKDLGTYTLYSAFSTQLKRDSFGSDGSREDLLALLISLGYLDNDLYVSKNFGTLDNFILTSQYASERAAIYQILKQNCYETFTIFDILPSLDIRFSSNKIEIQTPSLNALKIEIDFYHQDHANNSWVQFLNKPYGSLQPIITENKTRLDIGGTSKEVNKALKELVLNFENTGVCAAGTITVWDHLNPPVNRTIGNLSSYFEINGAPEVNTVKKGYDIQSQIDQIPVSTGQYFTITLFEETFSDQYTNSLSFEVALNNEEKSPAPSWLTIHGLNIKGTPPEELFHRKVNLLLIVKNEFKYIEIPFTLNIGISLWFAVKLSARYSPYILTVIGLWVYANRIYNVLCKKRYRHRKDFYISVGEEISVDKIYPVTFIGNEEAFESELLWGKLRADEDKIGNDKGKIIEKIQEIARDTTEKDSHRLSLYHKGSDLTRDLIHQLVLNDWAFWLLMNSPEEEETRRVFNEIKEKWTEVVSWDERGYCHVVEPKLIKILKGATKEMNESTLIDEEIRLVEKKVYKEMKGEVNMELLKDVMVGYAMKNQNVWKRAAEIHIEVKEDVQGNFIKRFLKRNLKNFHPGEKGQKVGYGIEFELKNDVLRFCGKAEEKFSGKTMVVQFTDLKQKILKELWIHGRADQNERVENSFIELGRFEKGNNGENEAL